MPHKKTDETDQLDNMVRLSAAARRAGITTQQLQYYLMIDLIKPAAMSKANQRLFDDATIKRIQMVKLLNDSGYPLREIRDIFMQRP